MNLQEIYWKLRNHPKGSKEIAEISRSMPYDNPAKRVVEAQRAIVDLVAGSRYKGDVEKFVNEYEEQRVTSVDIIEFTGKREIAKLAA